MRTSTRATKSDATATVERQSTTTASDARTRGRTRDARDSGRARAVGDARDDGARDVRGDGDARKRSRWDVERIRVDAGHGERCGGDWVDVDDGARRRRRRGRVRGAAVGGGTMGGGCGIRGVRRGDAGDANVGRGDGAYRRYRGVGDGNGAETTRGGWEIARGGGVRDEVVESRRARRRFR